MGEYDLSDIWSLINYILHSHTILQMWENLNCVSLVNNLYWVHVTFSNSALIPWWRNLNIQPKNQLIYVKI